MGKSKQFGSYSSAPWMRKLAIGLIFFHHVSSKVSLFSTVKLGSYATTGPGKSYRDTNWTLTECGGKCLQDVNCAAYRYDPEFCEILHSELDEYTENEIHDIDGPTEYYKIIGDPEPPGRKIIAAVFFHSENVYILVDYVNGKTSVLFFKDSNLHRPDSLLAIYDWSDIFAKPNSATETAWKSSSKACIFQSLDTGQYTLIICRGDGCGRYWTRSNGDLSSWDVDETYSGYSFDGTECKVTYKNDGLALTTLIGTSRVTVPAPGNPLIDMLGKAISTFLNARSNLPNRFHIIPHNAQEFKLPFPISKSIFVFSFFYLSGEGGINPHGDKTVYALFWQLQVNNPQDIKIDIFSPQRRIQVLYSRQP